MEMKASMAWSSWESQELVQYLSIRGTSTKTFNMNGKKLFKRDTKVRQHNLILLILQLSLASILGMISLNIYKLTHNTERIKHTSLP